MVIGARWGRRTGMPLWRRLGKRVLDYATALGSGGGAQKPAVTDSQSGFRAYGKRALDSVNPNHSGFSVESQMLIDANRMGLRIGEVPIHCRYDVEGSTQNPVRHAAGVLNEVLIQVGILHPLLLIGLPSFGILAAGLVTGGWALTLYQRDGSFYPGWVLLAMLLVILGILGLFAALLFNILPRSVERALARRGP